MDDATVYEYDDDTDLYSIEHRHLKDKGTAIEFYVFRQASIISFPDEPLGKKKRFRQSARKRR